MEARKIWMGWSPTATATDRGMPSSRSPREVTPARAGWLRRPRTLRCRSCIISYSALYYTYRCKKGCDMAPENSSNRMTPKVPRGGSRDAIVEAPVRLFLERGFGAVSMDELAEAAGVARRTLYNQFTSKEEIFREMLFRVSGQLEDAFPSGVETQGDVEDVLRLVARMILELHKHPEYLGFLRMVVADSRQFPWIAEEFATVMDPQTERLVRYLAHLTALGILDCR